MDEANPERGEVSITLGGKSYPMRPSWEAQRAIEERLGVSMAHLYSVVPSLVRGLKIEEKACIVTEGIKAAGKQRKDKMLLGVSEDRVGVLIWEAGELATLPPVKEFLAASLNGGVQEKKKASGKKKKPQARVTE